MGVQTVVVALLSLAAAGVHGCSTGFHDIGGQCFSFRSEVTATWEEARDLCAGMGPNIVLATVKSPDTHRDIYEYIIEYGLAGSYWLGASDMAVEGDWHWIDGSRVPRGTPYWAIHNSLIGWVQEPDGGAEENCLALDSTRKFYFNDLSCSLSHHALCEEL
ncbi:perlucin-like [Portunus trituberculatus]|uniref:perlucin-like n=1 Tax=Portunus trituberculatus TaxID=210409 RepID=UPI001E1D1596|nr:perlucin-like [Portunus trituberculatus]